MLTSRLNELRAEMSSGVKQLTEKSKMTERGSEVMTTHYLDRDEKKHRTLTQSVISTHKLHTLKDHLVSQVTINTSHMTETSQY